MKGLNNRHQVMPVFEAPDPASSKATGKLRNAIIPAIVLLVMTCGSIAQAVPHGAREQAKRIHDRIAGVPPTEEDLNYMEGRILAGAPMDAAERAIQNPNFYNATLKTYVAPMTNRDQSQFVPLNDYIATVVGMVHDNYDFREILTGSVLYTYTGNNSNVSPYNAGNNQHYEDIEREGINLGVALANDELSAVPQQSLTGVPAHANAGVLTSRAAAEAFFVLGTNRAMFRFTLLNHMCVDLEQIQDSTRIPDRIRQDVSRSPGGDSKIFLNNCISCHAGMDPMAGAFAYYNFENGALQYTEGQVQPKYSINSDNFPFGFVTTNDSWMNYWRDGPNQWLGWDSDVPAEGNGAQSMAREMAHSQAFAQCHVKKVFESVCLREPGNSDDRSQISAMLGQFNANHNLKEQFKMAAVHCMGETEVN